jgi:hypothetical protein
MRQSSRLQALYAGFATSIATLVAGILLASAVGESTHSGLLGICGPYGPDADLVGWMFLGSFPLSLIAGFTAAWYTVRRGARTPGANAALGQPNRTNETGKEQ